MTSNKLENLLHLVGWYSWKYDARTCKPYIWFYFLKMKYNSPQFEVRLFLCRTVCTQYAIYALIQTVQHETFCKLYMLKKHKEHTKDYTVMPVTWRTKWPITYMERTRSLLCIPCWAHENLYLKTWRRIKQLAVTWYWMLKTAKMALETRRSFDLLESPLFTATSHFLKFELSDLLRNVNK
jgi:hypothetical protein